MVQGENAWRRNPLITRSLSVVAPLCALRGGSHENLRTLRGDSRGVAGTGCGWPRRDRGVGLSCHVCRFPRMLFSQSGHDCGPIEAITALGHQNHSSSGRPRAGGTDSPLPGGRRPTGLSLSPVLWSPGIHGGFCGESPGRQGESPSGHPLSPGGLRTRLISTTISLSRRGRCVFLHFRVAEKPTAPQFLPHHRSL